MSFKMIAGLAIAASLCTASIMTAAQDDLTRWLPNPLLTPGALNPAVTESNIHQTICVRGWTKTVRPPVGYTNALKRQQWTEYGLGPFKPRLAEEDHRVPLEAGGNPTDPKNLWPQMWAGQWGAHVKDRLENLIHRRICSGQMTLQQGREVFLGNWITAYQRYVLHVRNVAVLP